MKKLLLFCYAFVVTDAAAQDTIMPLWPKDNIPNALASEEREELEQNGILRIAKVQEPTIEVYLPAKQNASGAAMLIFPGGGYRILAYDWEGTDMAKFLNSKGIAGIVVKYRLPSSVSQKDQHYVPLMDAQRAMRLVRAHAQNFHIDANKVGIMGFSAGGHLAATLGTHYADVVHGPLDQTDTLPARPDFMALIYPVTTFGEMGHGGSRRNLLGDAPTTALLDYFSTEKHVDKDTPPTFLLHASDDQVVPVENSLLFYTALKENGVPATMHIYPSGGHGFSLARGNVHLRGWTERLSEWMEALE
ncbi:alpha/beta hydrolase [Maribacter sp. 2307ULW6-5]|uniref:alpha/beta hydrolase n=1 Tax=Maribacter sp. 2307ULW6-5 TaxID=3386275 RepID=UPI0039BD849D